MPARNHLVVVTRRRAPSATRDDASSVISVQIFAFRRIISSANSPIPLDQDHLIEPLADDIIRDFLAVLFDQHFSVSLPPVGLPECRQDLLTGAFGELLSHVRLVVYILASGQPEPSEVARKALLNVWRRLASNGPLVDNIGGHLGRCSQILKRVQCPAGAGEVPLAGDGFGDPEQHRY